MICLAVPASPQYSAAKSANDFAAEKLIAKQPQNLQKPVKPITYRMLTEEQLRAERDSKAQEAMAKWAFWMLIASVIGYLLTILGLGFVWRTLHHTRRSADYAGQGIEQNQNLINRQLRAYVGPVSVAYHYSAETGCFAATAGIQNFGSTPAYKFKSRVTLEYLPYPVNSLPQISCADGVENTLFPSMQTLASNLLPLPAQRLSQISSSEHCFFLSIVLEYEDFTGRKHREKSGLYITGTPDSNLWNSSHAGAMIFLYGMSEEL
jgi:hypothetical protein